MDKKLSSWAKDNGKTYMQAYRAFERQEIKGAYKDNHGSIFIKENKPTYTESEGKEPTSVPWEETTASTTRRNRAGNIERTNRFTNIEEGLTPHNSATGTNVTQGSSNISPKEVVVLCQKAYYNFAIFRNVIDLMTEFSISDIYLKGGNKKARDFFHAWMKKIGVWSIQDKFYREYYRSGNVFLFRVDAEYEKSEINDLTKIYGISLATASLKLPIQYILLNPADIQASGNITFANSTYYKTLNDYELQRLKTPETEEEKEIFDSLPPEVKKGITAGQSVVLMELDKSRIYAIFYKKQDYEPFSMPMGFPVLDDLNWKAELKKMDMALTRTTQQAVLLVTTGTEPDKGGINYTFIEALRKIFANESIGRTLIADYTTDAKFVIPDIAAILDPKKYQVVNEDIQIGLNNILAGSEEKFSNQFIKVRLFIERLQNGRNIFLHHFLQPEIKRLAKEMGMKNYPTAYYQDFDLKDELEYSRIFTRLIEIGTLTPEEGLEAMQTGKLPTSEESMENQVKLRELKDKGMYEPVTGGPYSNEKLAKISAEQKEKAALNQPAGRPGGTSKPRKPSPVGGSWSVTKLKDNTILASELYNDIEKTLLKKHKIKSLNDEQKEIAKEISSLVIVNEEPQDWKSKYKDYIDKPVDKNEDRVRQVEALACEHGIDCLTAGLLFSSQYNA